MALLRGAEVERFLARPREDVTAVLLFGPDQGSVTERAAALAEKLSGGDSLSVIRLDEGDLSDAARLADEAYGRSLFAGRRVIRVRPGGSRTIVAALEAILGDPPSDTWIVIEAGDLRKTAPLRKLCESAPKAAAIGCYPDNDAAIGRLIDAEVKSAGLEIEPDARATLIALLGSDRAASRSEIVKLTLYAQSAGTITRNDVVTLIGDGAAFAIDDVVEAAAGGDAGAVDRGLKRLLAAGTAASTIGVAAERHFLLLHRARAAADDGAAVPPLSAIPSRRAAIERQLRLWPRTDLDDVLERINQAMIDLRLHPGVAWATIARTLLAIAARAARLARRAA